MTPILPAATTLIIRESTEVGIEVLLLKRNSKLVFAPGFWVFPGGRIDAARLMKKRGFVSIRRI
jgi:8-oxo-dGTP pyrophosphatase MutT (NUDIX family)